MHLIYGTSSTAQGGGGSFKNRKPIGEVGCCESWVAERTHRWTERWLEWIIRLSIYPSINPPIYLSTYLSIHPSIHLSIYLPIYLSICLSVCLSVYLSIYRSIYPSILPSFLPSFLSTDLSVCQPIHLSVFPSISHPSSYFVSICLSFFLFLSFEICPFPCLSVCLPVVLRSIHLSSCLSAHPAIHSIHLSAEAFRPSTYLVLHLSI